MTKYFYLIVGVLSIIGVIAIVNISNLLKEEPTFEIPSEEPNDDIGLETRGGTVEEKKLKTDLEESIDIIKPTFEVMVDKSGIDETIKYYRLVAGSYGTESNAKKMLQKIKELGYLEAEIIKDYERNLSRVIVAEYNDMDLAQMIKEQIESTHGIDIYMKTVQP